MDSTTNDDSMIDFTERIRSHDPREINMTKNRLIKSGVTTGKVKENYFLAAHNPDTRTIEEEDEDAARPVNFSKRPNGRGQKANSFHVPPGRELEVNVPTSLDTSCRPDLTLRNKYYKDPNVPAPEWYKRVYGGPKSQLKATRCITQSPYANRKKPTYSYLPSGSSFRKNMQEDQSFTSESDDSFEIPVQQSHESPKKELRDNQSAKTPTRNDDKIGLRTPTKKVQNEPKDSFKILEKKCRESPIKNMRPEKSVTFPNASNFTSLKERMKNYQSLEDSFEAMRPKKSVTFDLMSVSKKMKNDEQSFLSEWDAFLRGISPGLKATMEKARWRPNLGGAMSIKRNDEISASLRNKMQYDGSFLSEPADSFVEHEAHLKKEWDDRIKPDLADALSLKRNGGDSSSLRNKMQYYGSFLSEPGDSFLEHEAQYKSEESFLANEAQCKADLQKWISSSPSQKDSSVTLKIISQSNEAVSPCCNDAKGKLNHVAAMHAKKVQNLTKIVQRKAQDFESMLAENVKLTRNNNGLTGLSNAAGEKFKNQKAAREALETKHTVLQQKFDNIQQKIAQLESSGLSFNRQAADDMIDRLAANYEKVVAASDKQQEEIEELTDMVELFERDNNELTEKMTEMGFQVTAEISNRSQESSLLQSLANENSVLEDYSNKYQDRIIKLQNGITTLDSRVENLSALSEGLATKNDDLSMQLEKSYAGHDQSSLHNTRFSDEPSLNNTSANAPDESLDESMIKYANFCQDVSVDLQDIVHKQERRIFELENSLSEAPYRAPRRSI